MAQPLSPSWMAAAAGLASIVALGASPALPGPLPPPDCTVDAHLSEANGLELAVAYRCRSLVPISFVATDTRTVPHLRAVKVWHDTGVSEVGYSVDIETLAREAASTSFAVARDHGVLAVIGAWLLEPQGFDRIPTIDIRMVTARGLAFSSGLPRVGEAWRLARSTVGMAGYSALGRFAYREISVPGPGSLSPGAEPSDGVLRVALLPGVSAQGQDVIFDWVTATARAQANYWQGFTSERVLLGLVPQEGTRGVGFGRAQSGGGATVMVEIGVKADRRSLFDSWVLVHELIHTAMPYLRPRGGWMMEGAATYVEPIIRARAGWKSETEVWREWLENMPRGVPAFRTGLASASGRDAYWAGALFMLLADLAIREQTGGAKGLEHCLGGVLWSGLRAHDRLSVMDYGRACDRATGTTALTRLIDRHQHHGEAIDLAALWRDLGVSVSSERIVFDNQAPLAALRKGLVLGPGPAPQAPLPCKGPCN